MACAASLMPMESRGPGDPIDHGLGARSVAVLERAAQVDSTPRMPGLVAEILAESLGIIPKPLGDFGSQFGV